MDLELGGQHGAPELDVGPPQRPQTVQVPTTLTTSRTGRFEPSVAARASKRTPRWAVSLSSTRALYRSLAATVALNRPRPVLAQPGPIQSLDLVRDRHTGVQIGVARACRRPSHGAMRGPN